MSKITPTLDRLSELQMEAYRQGRYAETADKVVLCERVSERGCCGGIDDYGERAPDHCDLDAPCWRHGRLFEIVDRWWRRYC